MSEKEVKELTEEELAIKKIEEERERELRIILTTEVPIKDGGVETIGNIIDKEKDIWFDRVKPKPIINEDGFNKLVDATGVEFSEPNIIEKQSDFGGNQAQGQVWIEVTAKFSNEEYTDYGIANAINCSENISKSIMPIMALKRAKSRAFFRSKTINLPVFDESEVRSDIIDNIKKVNEKANDAYRQLNQQIIIAESSEKKFQKLFSLIRDYVSIDGEKVWEVDDLGKLNGWLNGRKGIEEYVLRARIRYINNQNNENNN